jgi:urease accessory protein
MTVRLQPHATLLLLPDPVTCFSAAAYSQVQRFTLHSTSSLALLDWLNSGRQALGEDWSLARYYSLNEIIVDGARVAKDAMLLEAETDAVEPRNALADRLAPYKCYATLILCGPLLQPLIGRLVAQHQKITVFRCKAPEATIWSLTPIASGIVVRIAGKETEDVKTWLRDSLSSLADVIGLDAYRRAFV